MEDIFPSFHHEHIYDAVANFKINFFHNLTSKIVSCMKEKAKLSNGRFWLYGDSFLGLCVYFS